MIYDIDYYLYVIMPFCQGTIPCCREIQALLIFKATAPKIYFYICTQCLLTRRQRLPFTKDYILYGSMLNSSFCMIPLLLYLYSYNYYGNRTQRKIRRKKYVLLKRRMSNALNTSQILSVFVGECLLCSFVCMVCVRLNVYICLCVNVCMYV